MLNENIRTIRKSKGLSQEELAIKLHVVRQTISKWEQGLSVPDADMLLALSEVFETPVSTLLGEQIAEPEADGLKAVAEKLEVLNLQLARRKAARQKALHWLFILLCVGIAAVFAALMVLNLPNRARYYRHPAVMGVLVHAMEWLFVRTAPILLAGGVVGAYLTRRKG